MVIPFINRERINLIGMCDGVLLHVTYTEQGRSEPDQTAKAYLKVIAANPEAIYQALQSTPH